LGDEYDYFCHDFCSLWPVACAPRAAACSAAIAVLLGPRLQAGCSRAAGLIPHRRTQGA